MFLNMNFRIALIKLELSKKGRKDKSLRKVSGRVREPHNGEGGVNDARGGMWIKNEVMW